MVFSPSHVWQSFLCRSVKLLMDCQDRVRCIDKKLHQVYNPWIASFCHTMHLQYKSCPVPLDIHPEWNKDVKYLPYYCWPHVFSYGTVMRCTQSGIFFPVAVRMTGSSTHLWCVANALAAPFAWQAFTKWHQMFRQIEAQKPLSLATLGDTSVWVGSLQSYWDDLRTLGQAPNSTEARRTAAMFGC